MRQLLNTDFVAIEVIRAIAGSIGIVCCVPCVSAISALLMGAAPIKFPFEKH